MVRRWSNIALVNQARGFSAAAAAAPAQAVRMAEPEEEVASPSRKAPEVRRRSTHVFAG